MDLNSNISEMINIPIQFLAIITMSFFLLDYTIIKRDFLRLLLFTILPTTLLFLFFGPLASFYLLLSILLFFKAKRVNRVFILHVLVSFTLAVVMDHFASIISFKLLSNLSSGLLLFIFRNLLFCLLLAISAYLYKRSIEYLTRKVVFNTKMLYLIISIIFLSLAFFYLNIMMMPNYRSYEAIQFNLWIFSIYFVLILIIAAAMIILSIKQYKIQAYKKEQQNFSNYLQLLEQTNEDTRSFQHDYINILTSLRHYIEKEDISALKTYFYDEILPTQQREIDNSIMLDELNHLKIDGLKGLLTTKFIHGKEHNIPIHLEVSEEIANISMDIIELNRILGILIDNAIEASKVIDIPMIRIAFIKLEQSTMIVILNKIPEDSELKVHDVFRKGYSTKGKNRGLGLSTLKEIINANKHIALHTKIDRHYFTQELEIKEVD